MMTTTNYVGLLPVGKSICAVMPPWQRLLFFLDFFEKNAESLTFATQSGELLVTKKGEYYELNFPAYAIHQVAVTSEMEEAIGVRPLEAWLGRDLVCVLPHENEVINANPDF